MCNSYTGIFEHMRTLCPTTICMDLYERFSGLSTIVLSALRNARDNRSAPIAPWARARHESRSHARTNDHIWASRFQHASGRRGRAALVRDPVPRTQETVGRSGRGSPSSSAPERAFAAIISIDIHARRCVKRAVASACISDTG